MRLSKTPISLNLNWKYPYDLRIYYDTHIHTFPNVSTEETYEWWPMQDQWMALLHKLWPPNIISYWKELILPREIADSGLRAESEQDEVTTSCHNHKSWEVFSVLSKEPRSQLKKPPLGEGLDNWASVRIIIAIIIYSDTKTKSHWLTFEENQEIKRYA